MLNINRTLMRICHPASWRGSGLITTPYPGLPSSPCGLRRDRYALGYYYAALRAQNSATLTLRKLLYKFQFVVESKQYSLIAGAINLHPTLQIRVQDILGSDKFAELWQCHDPMLPQVRREKCAGNIRIIGSRLMFFCKSDSPKVVE